MKKQFTKSEIQREKTRNENISRLVGQAGMAIKVIKDFGQLAPIPPLAVIELLELLREDRLFQMICEDHLYRAAAKKKKE